MQIHVALDPVTKTSKGIAFVAFVDPSCAVKAFEELDKTSFQGRLLHILPAAERSGVQAVEEKDGKSTLRGDKEKKRKEIFCWNMRLAPSISVYDMQGGWAGLSSPSSLLRQCDSKAAYSRNQEDPAGVCAPSFSLVRIPLLRTPPWDIKGEISKKRD